MKNVARFLAVAVVFVAAAAFAASTFDGNYTFISRSKEGKPDLAGWTGMMKIANGTMSRNFKSADGKETRFYDSTMKEEANGIFALKFTNAYKPEYVGTEHKNKISITGDTLTIAAPDGKFQEVWKKK